MDEVNILIESESRAFYLMLMIVFAQMCNRFLDVRYRNVHDIDLYLKNGLRSDANMPVESQHATFCVGINNDCPICLSS